jgi:hypothetical protein
MFFSGANKSPAPTPNPKFLPRLHHCRLYRVELRLRLVVKEEDTPMAAVEQVHVEVEDGWREEALVRDMVWRVENGPEVGKPGVAHDEAEEGRLPVVVAKAAEELGVGDDAGPQLADDGEAGQGGGLRREEEENLPE